MLTIYNTLTKSKEVFKPLDGNKVRMYVCGMTVYDYCHIGHGRSMVAFDLVTRWLRFSGYDLTYVRNITDIDDKIINRANQNGESFEALTARMIDAMHEDERRLNILPPDQEPRATDHIAIGIKQRFEPGNRQDAMISGHGDAIDNATIKDSCTANSKVDQTIRCINAEAAGADQSVRIGSRAIGQIGFA